MWYEQEIGDQTMYYQHRDGGYYYHVETAKLSTDGSSVEIYEHLWPFERATWVRPSVEFWDGRFTSVHGNEVYDVMKGDRMAAQDAVNKAKAARKNSTA